jgi:hypothetical protein
MVLGGGNLGWLRKTILSEAPRTAADDYQLDDEDTTAPDDEGDNTPPEDEGGDSTATDYQLDDGDTDDGSGDDAGEDDSTSDDEGTDDTGDEAPDDEGADDYQLDDSDTEGDDTADDDTSDETEDDTTDDTTGEEGDEDNLKKLILLNQFKEMNSLIYNLSLSITNLEKQPEFNNDDDLEYLQDKLESLKSKVSFTVQKKFLSTSYKDLLKLFYYFKFHLNDLANFTEKLIKEGNN